MNNERDVGSSGPPALCMRGITKAFSGVRALKGVDLALRGGTVHALLGENGAGKSTLVKILFGIQQADAGTIELDGLGVVQIDGPRAALAMGIGLVSQELSLVPQLDVAQNIFLGQTRGMRLVPRAQHRLEAKKILAGLAPHINVDSPVSALGMADRQLVEISRTLARGGRIIAFDEPTSSLTPAERDSLFAVIRRLKEAGTAIVYISHRMNEIQSISDYVTVLRDGNVVASDMIGTYSEHQLNDLIAGRELARELAGRRQSAATAGRPPIFELCNVSTKRVHDINLSISPGEIIGLAGLVGSGRSAILRSIFGIDNVTGGEIRVEGKSVDIQKPADAMAVGIALIPEDRRGQSIVPMMNMEQNFGLGNHRRLSRFGFLRGTLRRTEIRRYVEDMHIRPVNIGAEIRNLSGGNQQKVVIAKWLATGARVLLFDEPTRGVDVGAKAEIYALLRRIASDGAAILIVSSELPELLLLSDRIGVVSGGRLLRIIDNDEELSEGKLMNHTAGGVSHDA